ncbi:MAG: cytochrome b/b6 domain-containing protein [Coriobacteriia bacterium]|nr:cytochrome b/b6 domain-containing protein [Coriobacteriia bacterium]
MAHKLYREAHPMPFVLTHWINVLAMFFLTLSGFYIHFPIFPGLMGVARGTHFFWMFVLIINLALRIFLAFFVKTANMPDTREVDTDIKNWLPQQANRHQMWPWVKYYLFMKKDHPISAKYGVLQKIAYLATIPLTLLAAYTGFALWGPTSDWPFFLAGSIWVADMFGIGGASLMPMRIIHYWTMWLILIFTAAHVYLANIYNFAPSKMIFAWKESADH